MTLGLILCNVIPLIKCDLSVQILWGVTSLLPTHPDIPHTKTTPDIYRPQTVWERRGVSDTSAEYLLDCGVSPRLKPLQCLPWLAVAATNECVCVILTVPTHTVPLRVEQALALSLSPPPLSAPVSPPTAPVCLSGAAPLSEEGGAGGGGLWAWDRHRKPFFWMKARGKDRQDAGNVFTVV